MLRNAARIFIAVMLIVGAAQAGLAEKRVALVIGNSAYMSVPPLATPKNDAEDMAAALKALGFTVLLGLDLDKRGMDRKILEFESALHGADTGVFHYSGHGLQVAGVNYLLPVDASLESAAALRIEAVRLDFVQETMEREAKTNILFLDACRNNPLSRNLARALGTRSADIGQGLAATEAGLGTLIGFSTQPGNVALDGNGRNSPFSGPLAKAILTPGKDLFSILIEVRKEVLAATGGKQVTWDHSALSAPVYFQQYANATNAQPSEAGRVWADIKDKTDPRLFEAYRQQFGKANPYYDALAARRIAELTPAPALQPLPKQASAYCEAWKNTSGHRFFTMSWGTPSPLEKTGYRGNYALELGRFYAPPNFLIAVLIDPKGAHSTFKFVTQITQTVEFLGMDPQSGVARRVSYGWIDDPEFVTRALDAADHPASWHVHDCSLGDNFSSK